MVSTVIVDSHSHGWPRWPYQPPVPDSTSRGRLEQLVWEMNRAGVGQAVVVCAAIPHNPRNNDYVARHPEVASGRLHVFADIDSLWLDTYHTNGAAERLRRTARRLHLKGFTHYLREELDAWFDTLEGDRFLDTAESMGLILSLSAPPQWQPTIRRFAKRHPSLQIVCHHMGFVRRSGARWIGLREVLGSAEVPNIFLKVSGFHYAQATDVMQAWTIPETWAFPYTQGLDLFRKIYGAFGARRLCWGSDYPVVTRSMTYRQSLEVVRSRSKFVSPADMGWILGKTMLSLLNPKGNRN